METGARAAAVGLSVALMFATVMGVLWASSGSATAQAERSAAAQGDGALIARLDSWLAELKGESPVVQGEQAPQKMYRYRNQGRAVFTNIADNVPPAQRADAALDLSHVSLNTALGQRINARLQDAHALLAQSPACQAARAQDESVFSQARRLFKHHTGTCIFAGMFLVLLLMAPALMRRFDPLAIKRVLFFAIPTLGAAAAMSYGVERSGALVVQLTQGSFAERCDPAAYRELEGENAPLEVRMALVRTLDTQRRALDAVAAEGRSAAQGM